VGLCELVAILTKAVAKVRPTHDPKSALLVHILSAAPVYLDAGRLDAWDQAYTYARGNEPASAEIELLDMIFDLGSYNLYGAFDAAGTMAEYSRLVQNLERSGVPTPVVSELSVW
jgi:hypothetical protein